MKCSDIDTKTILKFLATCRAPAHAFGAEMDDKRNRAVAVAFPKDTPRKLRLAKMAKLVRAGYVTGCACGCRGDFEITDAGRALLRTS